MTRDMEDTMRIPVSMDGTVWVNELIRQRDEAKSVAADLRAEVEKLREQLDVERMRVVACGAVALADTPESATEARKMYRDCRSASLCTVEFMVDESIALRAENVQLREQLNAAVTLLAEWSHAVDGGASWDYWDNHYKQARWGKGILRSLIDAKIAKLEVKP